MIKSIVFCVFVSFVALAAPACRRHTSYAVGQHVQARSGDAWYAAEILATLPNEQFRVHYVGWGSEWDETVTYARLRLDGPVAPAPAGHTASAPSALAPAPASAAQPATSDENGRTVAAATPLATGQAVLTHWGARWYSSSVVSVLADGTVRVHYDGWGADQDENVARDRLRLPVVAGR